MDDEAIEEAMEAEEAVAVPKTPIGTEYTYFITRKIIIIIQHWTLESLPDMPHELLSSFFQHICLLDRIRINQVWPKRFCKFIQDYCNENYSKFKVSYPDFLKYTDCNSLDEFEFLAALNLLIPFMGQYITDLTVNYSYTNMDSVPAAISTVVRSYCNNLVRLHIIGISSHQNNPNVLLVPDMKTVESFVFTDSSTDCNQDKIIGLFLADCSSRLESLTINRSCINGECLKNLHNLRYLCLRSNMRLRKVLDDNEKPDEKMELTTLFIGDLPEYCKQSPVRHLDLHQPQMLVEDAIAITKMRHLTHLSMVIDNTASDSVNAFLYELLRSDTVQYLTLDGSESADYQIHQATLDVLNNVQNLREIHLKGVVVSDNLVRTLSALRSENVIDQYSF